MRIIVILLDINYLIVAIITSISILQFNPVSVATPLLRIVSVSDVLFLILLR